MQARMTSPAVLVPSAMKGIVEFANSANDLGVPATTLAMVHLRASQINGCSVCVALHSNTSMYGELSPDQLLTVAAWRDAPYFSEAERAALALAEAVTRLADRPDPVPDDIWAEAARHYDEQGLAALLIAIAAVNVWNRLNVATRQVAGEWKP